MSCCTLCETRLQTHHICNQVAWWTWLDRCLTDAERHVCHFSPKQQVVILPFLPVIWDKHDTLITQVSSPSLHELMSTNIRSFHVHFSIGTLCLLKSVSGTRCLQSQLIWSTKPWHSSGNRWRLLLNVANFAVSHFAVYTSPLVMNLYFMI